jgi:hypothetical protein
VTLRYFPVCASFFLIKFLLESFLMYSLRLKNVSKHKMYEIFSIAFFLSFLTQFSPFFLIAWHKLLLHVFFYFSPSEILIAFSCFFFKHLLPISDTHSRTHILWCHVKFQFQKVKNKKNKNKNQVKRESYRRRHHRNNCTSLNL